MVHLQQITHQGIQIRQLVLITHQGRELVQVVRIVQVAQAVQAVQAVAVTVIPDTSNRMINISTLKREIKTWQAVSIQTT